MRQRTQERSSTPQNRPGSCRLRGSSVRPRRWHGGPGFAWWRHHGLCGVEVRGREGGRQHHLHPIDPNHPGTYYTWPCPCSLFSLTSRDTRVLARPWHAQKRPPGRPSWAWQRTGSPPRARRLVVLPVEGKGGGERGGVCVRNKRYLARTWTWHRGLGHAVCVCVRALWRERRAQRPPRPCRGVGGEGSGGGSSSCRPSAQLDPTHAALAHGLQASALESLSIFLSTR